MAETLGSLLKKALLEKKKYKIVRVDKQDDNKNSFWLSATRNVDTNIFSVRDCCSYWLILEEMEQD